MDRKFPLEAQLLARSYDSHKVIELLQQRYAINDKPTLSLRPTEAEQKKDKALLTAIREKKTTYKLQQRNDQTKFVFKRYIKKSMHAQRMLQHRLAQLKKQGQEVDRTKLKEYKQIPKLEDFLQLNKLWIQYMQDLLGVTKENVDRLLNQQVLAKLSSADFNGCFLNVLKAKNKHLLNKSGVVIWDSKNFFIIVEQRGGIKMLEKKGTVFNFVIPLYDIDSEEVDENDENYLEFSIIGSRFQYRSADRSGRKFKSHTVDNLDV
jgi:ribonuclease P protein subunit POP4